jgi:exodeoxyribonuclease V gamma subunit
VSFVLHRSNDLDSLIDRLAEVVGGSASSPWDSELLVVQSRGMERWVSQQLARRLGVWANARFLFPRDLVELVLEQVLGEAPEVGHPFSRESLAWGVAALLPALLPTPPFAALRTYLEGDQGAVRRLQLARRIGDLFDQYVVYRPELVAAWERGDEDDWQAGLWRGLVERGSGRHLADRAGECIARMAETGSSLASDRLPGRVTLFGITTLPPLFLRVLGGLAAHLDVHLLQLSPCQEYWADLRPSEGPSQPLLPGLADPPATDANPLLASLGKLGRDFQTVLEDEVAYQEAPVDLYRDPLDGVSLSETPTVLSVLQSDILHQRRRAALGAIVEPTLVEAEDESFSVHSCHGPMREAEVLRDQLLALFDADPSLEPRHVLVMTPDMETYSPYLDAALGATATIPYSLADRSLRRSHPVVEGFGAVLDVLTGRFGATHLVDLLGHASVRERFGLTEEDAEAAHQWIADASIRWGVDDQHRSELDLPPYAENTWRFGLDRLLLAHAMPPDGQTLFASTLPCGAATGDRAAGLGGLADLCETLFELRTRLAVPRTVTAWRDVLVEVLERTVSVEPEPLEHQIVRDGLERLADQARVAGFEEPVALDAIRDVLESGFGASVGSAGFLTGGVTVCELLPMRSIPFRVIALVGMNDDAFPRSQRRLGFDRMGAKPRPGDRSVRDDDRYQFLECLLAARERLLVTYVGQSSRDNSPLPPSVVVSEVLDTLAESCRLEEGEDPRPEGNDPGAVAERFVVLHPLQPFSPRYFDPGDDARLFSFDAAQALGAARLREARHAQARFVTRLAPPEPVDELPLDVLVRFLENPARALVAGPLGLILGGEVSQLQDREPMELDGLARWQIGSQLLHESLERGGHRDPAEMYDVVRADGALPLGWPGRLAFEALLPGVGTLREALGEWMSQPELPPLRVDVEVDGPRITGWLRGLRTGAQLRYRYGKLRAKDHLAAWIHHLALSAMGGAGSTAETGGGDDRAPDTTVLVGQAARKVGEVEVSELIHAPEARAILASLVRLYEAGQRAPLRFFPEASLAYALAMSRAEVVDDAARAMGLDAAVRAFTSGRYNRGDDADVYVRQAHEGVEALFDPGEELAFGHVAMTVFGPLLDHRRRGT